MCRVADDESWLVGPGRSAGELLAWAVERARSVGEAAYAVDVTDAWSVCSIAGPESDEAWARLSENLVPAGRPAFVQGAVATVPAKAIVQEGSIHFFTPAPVGYHLPQRLLEACGDLAPTLCPATELTIHAAAVVPLAGTGSVRSRSRT